MAFEVRRTYVEWPEGDPAGGDGRGTNTRYPVGTEEVIHSRPQLSLAEKNLLQDIAEELNAMDDEGYKFLEVTLHTGGAPNVDGIPGAHRFAHVQDNHGQEVGEDWLHVGAIYYIVEV